MAIYVLVAASWDKTVDRICRLMDCREDFVKFLKKNIHPPFVIIQYSSLKTPLRNQKEQTTHQLIFLAVKWTLIHVWNLFYEINWTLKTLKCQGKRVKVMSSMNTDCMNFHFIGSLKLFTKKNEKKRNTNTKLNKTNKESAILRRCRKISK